MMLMVLYFGRGAMHQPGPGVPQFHPGNLDASPAVIAAFLIGTVLLAALMVWLESRPDIAIGDLDEASRTPTKPSDAGRHRS